MPPTFSPSLFASPLAPPALRPQNRARWSVKTHVEASDLDLARQVGISPVTAAILRSRGLSSADAVSRFFNPDATLLRDPNTLPDIEIVVERLHRAISQGETILVFGDYDVDGITSTALLVRALRAIGANVASKIPERDEGYGLTPRAIEELYAAGHRLILTADCGITAHEPALKARELGIDLLITDHHDCSETLPDALAVVNPKRADSTYGFHGLSGCGVAFKVMQALLQAHWPRYATSFEEKFVELVAMAAIADCVPLEDENRYLTTQGLRRLATTKKHGLQSLMRVAALKVQGDTLLGRHVSFTLAPRINAAGRLDSPTLALRLLLSTDPDECDKLAQELEDLNRARQDITRLATEEAGQLIESEANLERDCLLVAAREGWEKGVVGLIASKLVEKYARPAFAMKIHDGLAHGSGRSIEGFDLHDLIEATRPLLLNGGGHAQACGLSLESKNIPDFRAAAQEFAAARLTVADLSPHVRADCGVDGEHITPQLAEDLQKLEPCGVGNEAATLMLKHAKIVEARPIGQNGEHWKFRILTSGRQIDALWWRSAERGAQFRGGMMVDLVFVPELNTYNGRTNVQMVIKDARSY